MMTNKEILETLNLYVLNEALAEGMLHGSVFSAGRKNTGNERIRI